MIQNDYRLWFDVAIAKISLACFRLAVYPVKSTSRSTEQTNVM